MGIHRLVLESVATDVTPFAFAANGTWAAANLFLMVLVIVLACGEVVFLANSDDSVGVRARMLELCTIVPAIVSLLAFCVCQDFFGGSMTHYDNITILMGLLAAVQLGLVIASNRLR